MPLLLLLWALLSFAGALFYEMSRTEQEVRGYLASWEDELAKTLLVQKDPSFLNRVLGHVVTDDLLLTRLDAAAVGSLQGFEKVLSTVRTDAACLRRFEIPLTLYGLPATRVELCESPVGFAARGLLSPIFLGALLIGVSLIWFFRRETGRLLREKSTLQSRVHVQEDLARVSRQVAHDIRSPLSALQMVLSLAPDSSQPDEKNRILLTAVDRIRGISEELHSQGKLSLEGSSSVREIEKSFWKIRDELILLFPETEMTLASTSEESARLPLRPETWERILQNLLRNSCEAMRKSHEKKIVFRIETDAQGARLGVFDCGPGIPAHLTEKVGREGFQSEKEGGTGLGLTFVRRHVESVGGTVGFARPWGGGFEVNITCPILRSGSRVRVPGIA